MSYNNICTFPKEFDTPSETFRKTSGDLDHNKKALVTTTDMGDMVSGLDRFHSVNPITSA